MNERILQTAIACGVVAGAVVTFSLFFDVVVETAAERRSGLAQAPVAAPAGTDDTKGASAPTEATPTDEAAADATLQPDDDVRPSDEATKDAARSEAVATPTDTEESQGDDSEEAIPADDEDSASVDSGLDAREPEDDDGEASVLAEDDGAGETDSDSGESDGDDSEALAAIDDDDGDDDARAAEGDDDARAAEGDDGEAPALADEEEAADAEQAVAGRDSDAEEAGTVAPSDAAETASTAAKPLQLTPGAAPPAPPPVPSVGSSTETASQQAALPAATGLKLDLPLRCALGEDCWLVNYVDLDGSPEVRDYTCAKATYDGHKGTDFAVRDMASVRRGVAVVAAAPGVVVGTRDDMTDVSFKKLDEAAIKGRECGNGVIIGHPDGWTTQYCHMRRGSIAAAKGDSVVAGQALGMVGHSGKAEFPHLHFQVRKGAAIVDPFVGLGRTKACGPGRRPLWKAGAMARMPYRPTAVFNAGFSDSPPPREFGREGDFAKKVLARGVPKLVLWADIFWVMPGDILIISVEAPGGKKILNHKVAVKKMQAYRMIAATLRAHGKPWMAGLYRGQVRLVRAGTGGEQSSAASATVTLR